MDRVYEPHEMWRGGHDERMRPRPFAEETYTAQQRPVGDARRREDEVLARSEVLRPVDPSEVADAHLLEPLPVRLLGQHQLGLDLAVEASHGGRGQDALGSAA